MRAVLRRLVSAAASCGLRRASGQHRRHPWPIDVLPRDDDGGALAGASVGAVAPVNAPAAFLPLSESVVLHRDPDRFGLLYRLLWRLQVEPGLRADLILIEGDPLTDIRATRRIRRIWCGGVEHMPHG